MSTRYIKSGTNAADVAQAIPSGGSLSGESAGFAYQEDIQAVALRDPVTNDLLRIFTSPAGESVAERIKVIPITVVASTAEQDTGVDLPATAVVLDAYVQVLTAEATGTTKTVDVGTLSTESGGDADGFLDGISVATPTGVKVPSLVAGAVTRGVLLKETVTDSAAATHSSPLPYTTAAHPSARSISYTLGSNDFVELVAKIVIRYLEFGIA